MTRSFTGQNWHEMSAQDLAENERLWKSERRAVVRQCRNQVRQKDNLNIWRRLFG